MKKMGERLRSSRLIAKLSQIELAKAVDSFPQVIGDYERGRRGNRRPDIVLLVRICKVLNISIDWLFLGVKNKKVKKKSNK